MENKKKPLGKKILKWSLITLLVLIIGLFSVPFLFKDKIVEMVSNTINNNINATVTFKETDLSLFRNFPLASINVNDIVVANKAEFKGDTLFKAESLDFSMKITELFKKADEIIELNSIATKNGQVNIIFNEQNIGNYDIAIKTEDTSTKTSNDSFSFDIQEYELENMEFNYIDRSSDLKLQLKNINHQGNGNFAEDVLDLDTNTEAILSFDMAKTNYLHDVAISLDAVLGIDLKNSKYTFKENTGYINQLPLNFDGFIQLIDENQLYDINFKTPTSEFKNLLALLPKQYSGNLNAIKTEGNFDLNGTVKGILSEDKIPAFDISFSSKNAMFKYDDLPKAVKNINIDVNVINKSGFTKDTYVNIDQLTFKIDEDVFATNGNIANLTTNPKINLSAKGKINLENIGKVYPAPADLELAGILNADVSTSFDMNSVEKGLYKNIKNTGTISVNNFKYDGEDVANAFLINKTEVSFNTNTIKLNEFDAKTGNSDISVKGNLDNFYGFLFNKEVLKGNFSLNSNNFKVADFLTGATSTETTNNENAQLKIPAFLDCKFVANANNVVYDDITLKNVSGTIYVKDEAVNLQNLKTDVFGGKIGFDGKVSTKGNTSTFDVDLKLDQLSVAQSFSNLEMLKSIAPIANTIQGNFNSTIKVAGNLNEDMTPNLKTITGDLFGKLLDPKLNASNSKVLSLLSNKVSFLDADKLNLDGINAFLSFENGTVNVKPIPLKYKDIGIEISGNHSFDQSINYNIMFDVPVKYLGSEVTSLLAKLSPKDAAEVKSVPVKANLTGNFTSPNFTTNIKDATSNLINDLVEKQKQSLLNQGKNKLNNLLNINKNDKDSTETKENTSDKIKGVLGNLFGKKKTDTTKNNKQ
ncbi:AsmA family protein [Polaribacter vadi]|uniref:AsmA family protein n=1 Tax=Polaribacter TaxID=52959 RepID=UPI001C08356D|nr:MULTISPECIES: AsmA family protein [Polaribacter]MBU3011946.1 AsmA family protein [Polaribacter vadi]MDO6741761.1 AsmA-like C-terminal region-containing protein [Polaribacter sp. 1_MG-2023]